MLPFLEIGPIRVSSYIFMALLAFFASTLLVVIRCKLQNITAWEAATLSCVTMLGGVIGAKIFHIVGSIIKGEVSGRFWEMQFWRSFSLTSGFVWYGGVIGRSCFY